MGKNCVEDASLQRAGYLPRDTEQPDVESQPAGVRVEFVGLGGCVCLIFRPGPINDFPFPPKCNRPTLVVDCSFQPSKWVWQVEGDVAVGHHAVRGVHLHVVVVLLPVRCYGLLCWNHVAQPVVWNTIKPVFENIFVGPKWGSGRFLGENADTQNPFFFRFSPHFWIINI